MKLWLLRPIENLGDDDPWKPWYDKCFGFVIRAESAEAARAIAHEGAGDENRGQWNRTKANTTTPWLDARYSTCAELSPEGKAEMIIRDDHAA